MDYNLREALTDLAENISSILAGNKVVKVSESIGAGGRVEKTYAVVDKMR